MIIVRALDLISFFFLIFEIKMLVSYKAVEYERKKYLVATFVMCLPAILMSVGALITSIAIFYSISFVITSCMILISLLIVESITLSKIRECSCIGEQLE